VPTRPLILRLVPVPVARGLVFYQLDGRPKQYRYLPQLYSSRRGVYVHISHATLPHRSRHDPWQASDYHISIPQLSLTELFCDPIPPALHASCLFLPKEMRFNACPSCHERDWAAGAWVCTLCRAASYLTKPPVQARSRFPRFQTQSQDAFHMPPKRARLETKRAILRLCMLPKRTSFLAIFRKRGCWLSNLEIPAVP